MKARTRAIVLLILAGLMNGPAWADGKFYVRENVPAHLPYQRAFLLFDEGTETLIVQSKYELDPSASTNALAWVVPTPSVPELASMDAEFARSFFLIASLRTSPKVRHASPYLLLPVVLLLLGSVALSVLRSITTAPDASGPPSMWRRLRGVRDSALLMILVLLLLSTLMPHLSRSRGGLEILKTEQVGIYDVTVIRGDSAEPVMAWLQENGFAFGEEDKAVLADYVARGWCFVTTKVNPKVDPAEQRITAEGLAAPLVLTFATDKPVYPLALTAEAGPETQILLYTLSVKKLDCGGRLPLRHARQIRSGEVTRKLYIMTEPDEYGLMEGLPDRPMILCKFKGTLTAAQMREDLVLAEAADNTPYRETHWTW